MSINVDKSKSMVVGPRPVQTKCVVEGKEFEQVPDFSYLGTVISGNGKPDRELDNRICKAGKVCRQLYKTVFSKEEVSQQAKLSVYNVVFRPILFYGSESWVRSKDLIRTLEVADMRALSGISGENRWLQWQDRISNSDIRAELGTNAVGDKLDESILRWFGHLCNMEDGRQC
ncbi:hypothetical protein JGG94_23050 [Salmonella enterica subsp. enterica serovar Infantis]|nr:hypothetical protein [Salmonella enterica subsp. enterica serovar Infantis]